MAQLSITSVQLQVGEPVAGVTLEAYVKCEGGQFSWDDDGVEQSVLEPSSTFSVRCRWFRACVSDDHIRASISCHFHPDRPASFYCGFWKTELSAYGYVYAHACHCSLECFSEHFHVQRAYWQQANDARMKQRADGALPGNAVLKTCVR
jgi:hypothetical protein